MKSYLDLVPISAKVHRKQNRMSIICIVLAVFLVTAIFGKGTGGFYPPVPFGRTSFLV